LKCDAAEGSLITHLGEVGVAFELGDRFARNPAAVLREADEWDCAVIFEPDKPGLCMLNATAWLVFELCDGRSFGSIQAEYAALFGNKISKEEAGLQATLGIEHLLAFQLIERVDKDVGARP
jgi:hypothetical protein